MSSVATYEAGCIDSVAAFEQENERRHRVQMREEYLREVARRDEECMASYPRICPDCAATMHRHSKTGGREVITAAGIVKIRLGRLRCQACGHLTVPGAHLIPHAGVSAIAAERMCDLCAKGPYGKAASSLYIHHGITLSDKKLWSLVQAEAASITDTVAIAAERLYTLGQAPPMKDLEGKKPLIIGIDGGHIPHWGNKREKSSFEVKCVAMATGSERGPGKKRHLSDRVGYAADTDVRTFGMRVAALALAQGSLSASKVIFISDGAPWIPDLIDTFFPGSVHLLDIFHLKKRIRDTFTNTRVGCNACYRDAALYAADRYDPALLLHILQRWRPEKSTRGEYRDALIEYVTNNAGAIRAHRGSRIHGSGWIEKGVDLLISRRLKNRGMSWTRRGASHMIAFEVLLYNKQWELYWNQRKGLEPHAMAA